MRLSRLFRNTVPDEPRIEPQDQRSPAREGDRKDAASTRIREGASSEPAAYEDNLVLDLLAGTAEASSARFVFKIGDDTAGTATDALLGSLYEQYCQALDAPLAPRSDVWVPAPGGEDVSWGEQHQGGSGGDDIISPIAAVLGDIHSLEQAFGPINSGAHHAVAATDEVPEVLRLFAPAEYHAALSRRPGRILPSLVRREHHTLSIDSPVRPLNTPHSREQEPTQ